MNTWGCGCVVPRILNLGIRWRRVVCFLPHLHCSWRKNPCYLLDKSKGPRYMKSRHTGEVDVQLYPYLILVLDSGGRQVVSAIPWLLFSWDRQHPLGRMHMKELASSEF